MRAEVTDARDASQFLGNLSDDAPLFLRREVPGLVMQCERKSRSLNSGKSDSPK